MDTYFVLFYHILRTVEHITVEDLREYSMKTMFVLLKCILRCQGHSATVSSELILTSATIILEIDV